MDNQNYLTELKSALENAGKSARYRDACISYAERLLKSYLPVIFDKKHFSELIGISLVNLSHLLYCDTKYIYRRMIIPKKSGGSRELMMPISPIKYIQRWILDNIISVIPISKHATGFGEGCSIVDNATRHLGCELLMNFDIKDFFPTITIEEVFRIFYYYGYTKEMSYCFAKLCTVDGVLPQGSPASPTLSNIRCLKLDKRLSALCMRFNAVYTRYADDISISGACNI